MMSRVAKWKAEKTKVKVVFRLQFHATHIPQPGWDKLFLTFIPTDSGKATAKTTKANVRNGNCKWSDPVYETTRLFLDAKTKRYDEKLYKLVVAMGSSRSSILGEAHINLAEYADASKPSTAVLPLHGCNSGTVLHVTVQLLTSKTGFREFEQQRELREKGFQIITDPTMHEEHSDKVPAAAAMASDQTEKVSARVRFKSDSTELPSLDEGELNEEYADSAVGMDGSSHTSESLYAEKHDISSTNEIDSLKSAMSGEYSLGQSLHPEKGDQCDPQLLTRGTSDWVHGWSSDYSMDNDLSPAYEENNRLRGSLEVAEAAISELKLELSSLQSHADELGGETQKLARQLEEEIASGEELAREVSLLKSECSKLKENFEQHKHSKGSPYFTNMKTESFNTDALGTVIVRTEVGPVTDHQKSSSLLSSHVQVQPEEMKSGPENVADSDIMLLENANGENQDHLLHDQERRWMQGLLLMEDKVRAIHDKTCLRHQDKDLSFLYPDLKALVCLLLDLKEVTSGATSVVNFEPAESTMLSEQFMPQDGLEAGDADLYPSEGLIQCSSQPGQFPVNLNPSEHNLVIAEATRAKVCELLSELEESKTEHEGLLKKMNQMECYYEALIQELEENQKQMLHELQNLRNEHSTCHFTVSTLENQMENMQLDMNVQFARFAEDRCELEYLNKELERKATTSETVLKRLRWNYSLAVDQLQKDLELLSFQVLSMFETNQNLAKQAFTEASQLCFHEYIEGHSEELTSCSLKDDLGTGSRKEQHQTSVQGATVEFNIPGKTELLLDLGGRLTHPKEEVPVRCTLESTLCSPEFDPIKTLVSHSQKVESKKHLFIEKEKERACQLQQELHLKAEAELSEMHLVNLQLNIFSSVLQQTLHEANNRIKLLKEKIDELAKQLEHSNQLNELLMPKLQNALGNLEELRESKLKSIAKCDDLTLKSQILEGNLRDALNEKYLLSERVAECEAVIIECRSYRNKYETCTAEKSDLENVLKQEMVEKRNLQTEINSLVNELESLKAEVDKQSAVKEDLEKTVTFLHVKLEYLSFSMLSFTEHINGKNGASNCPAQELENKNLAGTFIELEELQRNAYNQILQLKQEKDLEEQKDIAQGSISTAESQILSMGWKFDSNVQDIKEKLNGANALVEKLQLGLQDLACKLRNSSEVEEKYAEENRVLSSKLVELEIELQNVTSENRDLAQKILKFECVSEELEGTKKHVADYKHENRDLLSKLSELEIELQNVTSENRDLAQKILTFESVNEELERTKKNVADYMQENRTLMLSLKAGNEESLLMQNQLSGLKERLRCTSAELQSERGWRGKLEAMVTDLTFHLNEKYEHMEAFTSQLNDMQERVLSFDCQKAELLDFRQQVSDLELEKSNLRHLLLQYEESQRKAEDDTSFLRLRVTDLETHLAAMHAYSLAADVEVTFMKDQFHVKGQEFIDQLKSVESYRTDLHFRHLDIVARLDSCMAREAQHFEENAQLMTALQSLKSEFKTIVSEKRELEDYVDKRNAMWTELENSKTGELMVEHDNSQERHGLEAEIENLKSMMVSAEEEIDNLRSSRDQLEVTVTVLKSKLDEQRTQILLLQEYDDELMKLWNQHNEITQKLSDQILKTEGFKNLSICLTQLKENANTGYMQACERKDNEGPSVVMQESLQIAFIRGQCETKLQELRSQLYVSKKHGEEMLLKFQNALDEIESRKKSEASHVKINQGLSLKILELEAELQTVLTEKQEKANAYDRMKAELGCSIISLNCCKEEKQKLEASLLECIEERTRTASELNLVKERLASTANDQEKGNHEIGSMNSMSIELLLENSSSMLSVFRPETPAAGGSCLGNDTGELSAAGNVNNMDKHEVSDLHRMLSSSREVEDLSPVSTNESKHSCVQASESQSVQDAAVLKNALEVSREVLVGQEDMPQNDAKHVALINEHFREQQLKSSMDCLQKELERLKEENLATVLPREHELDPTSEGLQRQLLQLDMANERLGSIFPLFNNFSGGGNPLERVLALEVELAETLQAKKKSSIQLQSSFLKQHNDEQAVFQSFRDINELIKDMLELKRKYGAVEIELKEMHERYSELSLQFAEVEGERQKLVMTLKNVRSPKKP